MENARPHVQKQLFQRGGRNRYLTLLVIGQTLILFDAEWPIRSSDSFVQPKNDGLASDRIPPSRPDRSTDGRPLLPLPVLPLGLLAMLLLML
mgnify:CR=1 FL=1